MDEQQPLKKYADGWISEKPDSEVPGFLKLAFIVVGLGCVSYFILYINGDVTQPDRGRLVQDLNRSTEPADSLMYVVAGMALFYVLAVLAFVFRKVGKPE
jgi:hypothetical protein